MFNIMILLMATQFYTFFKNLPNYSLKWWILIKLKELVELNTQFIYFQPFLFFNKCFTAIRFLLNITLAEFPRCDLMKICKHTNSRW